MSSAQKVLHLLLCAVCLALIGLYWFMLGRPQVLPEALGAGEKLNCMSYSPFDKDQSPFDKPFTIREARLEADLALLSKHTRCIRTYSQTGLEALPGIARKHGLKLLLGAWVNANRDDTRIEVESLIRAANANPDVVEAVVVGNETLLRKEVTGAQLAQWIREVKGRVQQPVTYADVWEFWDHHPEVAPAVDFITIHLLPYWEDQPRDIEDALTHVQRVYDDFAKRFAPKDILIGEVGWPSEGRQREAAVPSRVDEARFIRGVLERAQQGHWHYNLIEAFDQPWKRASEGAVGGYWGLFDADRQDKGILKGPVSNVPQWQGWALFCGLVFVVTLVLAGTPQSRRHLLQPCLLTLGALCLGEWLRLVDLTARFWGEWLWGLSLAALNLLLLLRCALDDHRQGWRCKLEQILHRQDSHALLACGFAAAVFTLGLVFDARYRSFPSAALLFPALWFCLTPAHLPRRQGIFLLSLIALGIPAQLIEETLSNTQALSWALTATLTCIALGIGLQSGRSAVKTA